MSMWRIVGGVVLAAALLTTGYWVFIGFDVGHKSAEDYVKGAIDGLQRNRAITDVKSDIHDAIENLPKTEATATEVGQIEKSLNSVHAKLTEKLDDTTRNQAIADLEAVILQIHSLPPPPASTERSWKDWSLLVVLIVIGVVTALLLAAAAMSIWKHAWRNVEINVARIVNGHIGLERKAQPDFTDKLTSLSSSQKEINSNLIDLQTEVRTLARMVRESLADRNDRRPPALPLSYQPQSDGSTLKDEPEFPVSVNEYLGKMSRYASAVKLDFQNGILVNDPDNKDELFLIRDSREVDDGKALFLVPGAAQFHNKQDFEIYYSKYYNCPRPQMGDVWIIGPAVVQKVPGGWQLREKGMLEVR
jgi:hypothetical protein